jgi:mannose-6-phosphate isomerase-like protein (cupin superfamily)
VCINIPLGTAFQYRCTGDVALVFTCTALPPWPGDDEGVITDGPWVPKPDLQLGASSSDQSPQHA